MIFNYEENYMTTKKVVGSMKLTEEEKMALFEDGNIDLGIEFLKFVKLQSKKHVIGSGWVGIDVLPHSDSVIVNKLWDEKMETEKKKK
jgi:hypothetical protein